MQIVVNALIVNDYQYQIKDYHLRAQRHYTDLLYKAEGTDRITYWDNTHKIRKVSSEDHSSHVL